MTHPTGGEPPSPIGTIDRPKQAMRTPLAGGRGLRPSLRQSALRTRSHDAVAASSRTEPAACAGPLFDDIAPRAAALMRSAAAPRE